MKAPKTATELERLLAEIDADGGDEAIRRRLDLMLHLLLEIRNNLRGY